MTQPVQTIDVLLAEHAELELALADPALHSNPAEARRVGRRFARLAPIVATHRKLTSARDDLETARELVASDESFAAEVAALEARVGELDAQLTDMLAPRDPHDADDIVLEVKSGEGGRRIRVVRRRFGQDVYPLRRAARLGGDGVGRDHLGSGWVQGRDVGDCQQSRHPPTGCGRA